MRSFEDRLWSRVIKTSDCWIWTGAKNSYGYGQIHKDGKNVYVHRVSFEIHKGPIPKGLVLDHLCRVRHCLNPDHLEAVTNQENMARAPKGMLGGNRHKTHCIRGHSLFGPHVRIDKNGARVCRKCRKIRDRFYRARDHKARNQ